LGGGFSLLSGSPSAIVHILAILVTPSPGNIFLKAKTPFGRAFYALLTLYGFTKLV
jgi:hypothetical protein